MVKSNFIGQQIYFELNQGEAFLLLKYESDPINNFTIGKNVQEVGSVELLKLHENT